MYDEAMSELKNPKKYVPFDEVNANYVSRQIYVNQTKDVADNYVSRGLLEAERLKFSNSEKEKLSLYYTIDHVKEAYIRNEDHQLKLDKERELCDLNISLNYETKKMYTDVQAQVASLNKQIATDYVPKSDFTRQQGATQDCKNDITANYISRLNVNRDYLYRSDCSNNINQAEARVRLSESEDKLRNYTKNEVVASSYTTNQKYQDDINREQTACSNQKSIMQTGFDDLLETNYFSKLFVRDNYKTNNQYKTLDATRSNLFERVQTLTSTANANAALVTRYRKSDAAFIMVNETLVPLANINNLAASDVCGAFGLGCPINRRCVNGKCI
jgi:hypothetical protein